MMMEECINKSSRNLSLSSRSLTISPEEISAIPATKPFPNLYSDTPSSSRLVPLSSRINPQLESRKRCFIGSFSIFLLFFVSFGSSFLMRLLSENHSNVYDMMYERIMIGSIHSHTMQDFVQFYSNKSRQAGTENDLELINFIKDKALSFGIPNDSIRIEEFEVMLNTPKAVELELLVPFRKKFNISDSPNILSFKLGKRKSIPHHLFSKDGNITGKLIYANYGLKEDFELLKKESIMIQGNLVMVRLGKIPIAVKVYNAEKYGAIGLISYSDPADTGQGRGIPVPNGPWQPMSSITTGSVHMGFGDPSTPLEASESPSNRIPSTQIFNTSRQSRGVLMNIKKFDLPSIPSIPISGEIAQDLFNSMSGIDTVKFLGWSGSLNTTYHVDGGRIKLRLVNMNNYTVRKVWNLVVTLEGSHRPERYIVIGSRRDSVVGGAVSPGSGVAVYLELLHGFGQLLKSGWKPIRSIVLGSWDAEEYGLVGSTEWLQKHHAHLSSKAIVYADIGSAVSGKGNFIGSASGSLKSVLYNVSKIVEHPFSKYENKSSTLENAESVYHVWSNSSVQNESDIPKIHFPQISGFVSPFLGYLGIPSIHFGFYDDHYEVKDSIIDSMDWISRFGDSNFTYHRTIASMWGSLILKFSNSVFLPYDFYSYALELRNISHQIEQMANKVTSMKSLNFTTLDWSINKLQDAALNLVKEIEKINENSIHVSKGIIEEDVARIWEINDRMVSAEHHFLNPTDISWHRHVLYGLRQAKNFEPDICPRLKDALNREDVEDAKTHLMELSEFIQKVASILSIKII